MLEVLVTAKSGDVEKAEKVKEVKETCKAPTEESANDEELEIMRKRELLKKGLLKGGKKKAAPKPEKDV